ncbi:hypothetical protein H257_10298 [Aphanomyces astaci]|uniref:Uncharacterized protein n=1 Tax=Aphanomyces astaci TaxID=112090 RepID=W4G6X4_APHAT|nr:hypothetical protein H257_10298 [Aphanomyces astaci]ETV75457.1 hypothetical protein H257_10298 [Aphanomyces astaci]|eukprot:XP_009835091.1 hypothetical protein H257_10298 [Aphanomyces astaci]
MSLPSTLPAGALPYAAYLPEIAAVQRLGQHLGNQVQAAVHEQSARLDDVQNAQQMEMNNRLMAELEDKKSSSSSCTHRRSRLSLTSKVCTKLPPSPTTAPAVAGVQVICGFQEVPKAPTFNGSTKIQRAPLSACIDPFSFERIAYWEIWKVSHELTFDDWKELSFTVSDLRALEHIVLGAQALQTRTFSMSTFTTATTSGAFPDLGDQLVGLGGGGNRRGHQRLELAVATHVVRQPALEIAHVRSTVSFGSASANPSIERRMRTASKSETNFDTRDSADCTVVSILSLAIAAIAVPGTPIKVKGFVGPAHTVTEEATMDLRFKTDAGPLMLTNVKCWVSTGDLPANAESFTDAIDMADAVSHSGVVQAVLAVSHKLVDDLAEEEEEVLPLEMVSCFPDMVAGETAAETTKVKEGLDAKLYVDVFRLSLGGDPPVKMPLLKVHLANGARPIRCKARRYSLPQREFMQQHVKELEAAGFVYRNPASRWASVPLIVRKPHTKDEFRMTVDLDQQPD